MVSVKNNKYRIKNRDLQVTTSFNKFIKHHSEQCTVLLNEGNMQIKKF